MTWVFVKPKDVWLFRNGKPFSSGEDHSATSLFPPTPLTVQGALRAKISIGIGVSLREYRSSSVNLTIYFFAGICHLSFLMTIPFIIHHVLIDMVLG